MRLTENERRVLSAVENRPEVPLTVLQKTTKLRASAIRYHLKNLIDRKILRYYPFINTYPLGYTHHNIFFSLSSEGMNREAELVEFLRQSPAVSYMVELGGGYQYGVTALARSPKEVNAFMDQIGSKFGPVFSKLDFATQISLAMYPTKYLQSRLINESVLSWGECTHRVEIDDLDKRILFALVNEQYSSRRDLARLLGQSISTIEYRIKRLMQEKVIVDFVYLVTPPEIGMLEYKVLVHLKGRDSKFHEELLHLAKTHPYIVTVIEALGTWAYELSVEVDSPAQLPRAIQEFHKRLGKYVSHLQELTICRTLKLSCFPFWEQGAKATVQKRASNS